jgi:hypothetical protein
MEEEEGTRLTPEHIAPVGILEEHCDSYGPSAVGTGWDLALAWLRMFLASGEPIGHGQFEQWSTKHGGLATEVAPR